MRYVKNPEVIVREEDVDGALLFNPDTDQIRAVNATGFFMWNLCDGQHSVSDIVTAVQREFDGATGPEVEKEVADFLNYLTQDQLTGVVVD